MAAPAVIAVHSPSGVQMPEGFSIKLAFSLLPNAPMWELEASILEADGGEPIKMTSMRNIAVHTFKFRKLKKYGPVDIKVSFDPKIVEDVDAILNTNQTCTEWLPDGSTYSFFGAIIKRGKIDMKEGEIPTCMITVHASNIDPSDNKTEYAPVFTPATGT